MRQAEITRNTLETRIKVRLDLDGSGQGKFASGVPFLDHMLDQVARHGMIDLEVEAQGDLHIDAHHTVEDIGISIGQALARALPAKTLGGHFAAAPDLAPILAAALKPGDAVMIKSSNGIGFSKIVDALLKQFPPVKEAA